MNCDSASFNSVWYGMIFLDLPFECMVGQLGNQYSDDYDWGSGSSYKPEVSRLNSGLYINTYELTSMTSYEFPKQLKAPIIRYNNMASRL